MEFLQSLLGAFIALLELSMRGQERIVQRVVAHLARAAAAAKLRSGQKTPQLVGTCRHCSDGEC